MNRLIYGLAHYYTLDLRERPEVARSALELLAYDSDLPLAFQGMFRDTDRFSRWTRASARALDQLVVDIAGGVYDSIIGVLGPRSNPIASVTFEVSPHGPGYFLPGSLSLSLSCHSSEEVERAVGFAATLWRMFQADYGFSLFGCSDNEVMSELSHTPILAWDAPDREATEVRLMRLQTLRRNFGHIVRGAAWGNYLSDTLVTRLGGGARIEADAPVAKVQKLEQRGMYLQLLAAPEPFTSQSYRAAADRLEDYFRLVAVSETAEN